MSNSMLLISATWGEKKSFKLIPVTNNPVYLEGIFDPETNVLALISPLKKEGYHMVPKLDDNGDMVSTKGPRKNGKTYKEERKTLETYQEYYITEREEIINMIDTIAVNHSDFNYKQYFTATKE